jgi:hypothetical protein
MSAVSSSLAYPSDTCADIGLDTLPSNALAMPRAISSFKDGTCRPNLCGPREKSDTDGIKIINTLPLLPSPPPNYPLKSPPPPKPFHKNPPPSPNLLWIANDVAFVIVEDYLLLFGKAPNYPFGRRPSLGPFPKVSGAHLDVKDIALAGSFHHLRILWFPTSVKKRKSYINQFVCKSTSHIPNACIHIIYSEYLIN